MSAFEQAQKDVKTLTQRPGNDDMLALYAHFKQASQGDASGSRPGMFDMINRAKFASFPIHPSLLLIQRYGFLRCF